MALKPRHRTNRSSWWGIKQGVTCAFAVCGRALKCSDNGTVVTKVVQEEKKAASWQQTCRARYSLSVNKVRSPCVVSQLLQSWSKDQPQNRYHHFCKVWSLRLFKCILWGVRLSRGLLVNITYAYLPLSAANSRANSLGCSKMLKE